jgi:ubiquinone/menaquinone biosynthesis C-methylase UbiE
MTNEFTSNKKRLFDLWAPSYDFFFLTIFYQAVHKRLLEYVDLPSKSDVLDIGCGTGRLLNRLAANFPDMRGFGLDLSPQMLRVAREKNNHHPRLIFVEGKAESLPFAENQFDAVFNTISFLHYPEPQQFFSEVARVLKKGGRFYLVDSALPSSYLSVAAVRFYSKQERENLGSDVGLSCLGHHYLMGPVLLSVFAKLTQAA